MDKLNKVISTAKKLTDLPYNQFNLENYENILFKKYLAVDVLPTAENLPIRLMSGNNLHSGIIISESYHLSNSQKKKIYLVGKGVLFDSGGLDIKPSGEFTDMSNDKAGMIITLAVANYIKGNVVAYCPVTTNFVQNSLITPGDEIKIGKKIVRVTNTDAEGRLILAEALSTLKVNKNDIVITIATLTGAVGRAIGEEATGVFSDNNELLKKYAEASFQAKELSWALPMWEHYQTDYYNQKTINNHIKEIKAGATQAAMFIKQFVPYPNQWIHLDIASSAFYKDGTANGVPLKSLVNFIRRLQ